MTPERIKEKIGLLKLYLTINLASTVTAFVWLGQNIETVNKSSFAFIATFLIIAFIFVILLEIRIRKLINLL